VSTIETLAIAFVTILLPACLAAEELGRETAPSDAPRIVGERAEGAEASADDGAAKGRVETAASKDCLASERR
jgi:hypothetical protein